MDGNLKIWDLGNYSCRHICQHDGGIVRLRWHDWLPLVYTACTDGVVRLWDARSGHCLYELTGHQVRTTTTTTTMTTVYLHIHTYIHTASQPASQPASPHITTLAADLLRLLGLCTWQDMVLDVAVLCRPAAEGGDVVLTGSDDGKAKVFSVSLE
jgi:WD40 repeat protein